MNRARNDGDAQSRYINLDNLDRRCFCGSILDLCREITTSMAIVDRDYRFLFFNQSYERDAAQNHGVSIRLGMCSLDTVENDATREKLKNACDRAFAGDESTFADYDQDRERIRETSVRPIKEATGSIIGAALVRGCAVQHNLAEEASRRGDSEFKALFMSIPDGFYLSKVLYDEHDNPVDYRYLEVNPTFERILGVSREGIVGKRYTELVPNDTTQWLANYCSVARTGQSRTFDFYSSEYRCHFETFAYRVAQGQVAVFVRDVTERKRTELALQNAQRLESLGTLAGGIAHDFNNMLCSVFGCVDLASAYLASGEVTEAKTELSVAMQSLDMLKSLSRQLLTFAKGGAPRRKVAQLDELIRSSCMLSVSGSPVQCRVDIASDLKACECDQNQVAQMLTNIVINAKQAMPQGGEVNVSAKNIELQPGENAGLPEGGTFVEISIRDEGVGIPPEIIKSIFDPFFTTKETGHGLGLSTSFSIVKRHNGQIEVESNPGIGTKFRVLLPAALNGTVRSDSERPQKYQGRGQVLVMDDQEPVLHIYRQMIPLTGHTVVEAKDGDDAIALFRQAIEAKRPYVMTILDLTIRGGKGGAAVLSEIRRLQPDAIVVVASGYSDDPRMADPTRVGFNDSLVKPFTRLDLERLFLRIFRNE